MASGPLRQDQNRQKPHNRSGNQVVHLQPDRDLSSAEKTPYLLGFDSSERSEIETG